MRSRSQRVGFTLLELLIVVLILALLAALLFPVLASARGAARRAETAHEDRMAALAELAAAEDNENSEELDLESHAPARGQRVGGTVGRLCAGITTGIYLDYVNDGIGPPQSFQVTSGTYPQAGSAYFKVYAAIQYRGSTIGDVTAEYRTRRIRFSTTRAPGSTSVRGKLHFDRFAGTVQYVPIGYPFLSRKAMITATYDCGAFGTYTSPAFTLTIPPGPL